ncbi:TcaA NTF2-like domain-containing protein [Evansella cellulosilytica]|uniref:TcaA protein NTF2-like domain-containing protein n=1 Tax=Evansella cellulosilytica (strain ATCC 21833 / DSM 2522 / FERM P-1141 / JCM 9156 / N-4) TaxID=649639 RepID=E6TZK9_EVAC2|nr:hypothetical protein [Evansella cellulosilytica]ADU30183.1 hypothetical protein Bcell_1921 [Evansella cellulosilytica DSM 2522]
MNKWKVVFISFLFLFLVACNEEENWTTYQGNTKEVETFIYTYLEEWGISLEQQNFSMLEQYFVANSHIYHMVRRQHQQTLTERKIETFITGEDQTIEINEHGELRWTWKETFFVDSLGSSDEIIRTRAYRLIPFNDSYKIIAIEREV